MHLSVIVTAVVLVLGTIFAISIDRTAAQSRALQGYEQYTGEVVDSDPARGRLRVRYEVGGQSYETARLTPLPPLIGDDASALVTRIAAEPGEAATVWVHPSKRDRAYLVRTARVWPYALQTVAFAGAMGFVVLLFSGGVFEARPGTETRSRYDWHPLRASLASSHASKLAAVGVAVWCLMGVSCLGEIALTVRDLRALEGMGAAAAVAVPYAGVGLVCVAITVKRWRAGAPMGEPAVVAMQPGVRLDRPVIVRVAWPVARGTTIDKASASLACVRRTGVASQTLFRTSRELDAPPPGSGGRITGECAFEAPAKKRRPSSPFSRWHYPRIDWLVEVEASHAGGVARVRFPLDAAAKAGPQHAETEGDGGG